MKIFSDRDALTGRFRKGIFGDEDPISKLIKKGDIRDLVKERDSLMLMRAECRHVRSYLYSYRSSLRKEEERVDSKGELQERGWAISEIGGLVQARENQYNYDIGRLQKELETRPMWSAKDEIKVFTGFKYNEEKNEWRVEDYRPIYQEPVEPEYTDENIQQMMKTWGINEDSDWNN